jgi:hypothetical protein
VGSKFQNNLVGNRVGRDADISEGVREASDRPVSPPVSIRPPRADSPRKQALTKMRMQFLQSQGKM